MFECNIDDQRNFRFIIDSPGYGAIGIATLTEIDWKNRQATHGIKLDLNRKHTRGTGTDAVMALMRYAFDELGLKRLDGSRFNFNDSICRLYKGCGWSDEGLKRQ